MSTTQDTKSTGVRGDLLVSCFQTLFPGCRHEWKNSQGIFDSLDRCMAKRSLCFSSRPVSLSSAFSKAVVRGNIPRTPAVWGVCGVTPTRANKATDSCFILCKKSDKHFVACAVICLIRDPEAATGLQVSSVNTDNEYIDSFLLQMKKEKEEYCKEKWEKKIAKKRGRSSPDEKEEFVPPKAPRMESQPEVISQQNPMIGVCSTAFSDEASEVKSTDEDDFKSDQFRADTPVFDSYPITFEQHDSLIINPFDDETDLNRGEDLSSFSPFSDCVSIGSEDPWGMCLSWI